MTSQKEYIFTIILALFFFFKVHSENTKIKGVCIDAFDKKPIALAYIQIPEFLVWSFTNAQGEFLLENLPTKQVQIQVSCLGYESFQTVLTLSKLDTTFFKVEMYPSVLGLKELVVSAQAGTSMSTSTIINTTSLQHVQATSINDALQLLPGNRIENPELSKPQQLSIREIDPDANSSAGVQLMMDGLPIDNDANLQSFDINRVYAYEKGLTQPDFIRFQTTIGAGVDARRLAVNNIASIEVVKGIPSVEYGNSTTGLVLVKTKTGVTPLEVVLKSDQYIKQAYVGKGKRLENGGVMNASLDYTSSVNDIRSKYQGYDRLNGQVSYYQIFGSSHPLSFNVKGTGYTTINEQKTDPDAMVANELFRTEDQGGSIAIFGDYLPHNKWISTLAYSLNASVSAQENYQKTYRTGAEQGVSVSMDEGENYGVILPSESLTEYTVSGLPVMAYGKVVAKKNWSFLKKGSNIFMVGGDFRLNANYGKGTSYDLTNPPNVSIYATRPQTFSDIPALNTLSYFFEDKFMWTSKHFIFELKGGVRINNFQSRNVINSDVGVYASPLMNFRYTFLTRHSSLFKKLTIRGGGGRMYKTIPLAFLYPQNTYFDLQSLYHYSENPSNRTVVLTTHIIESSNPNLKPTQNTKFELGFDFGIGSSVKASFTAFNEKMINGYGLNLSYVFLPFRVYDVSQVADNQIPDIENLPFTQNTYLGFYNRPVNNKGSIKKGIEYSFDLGKIPVLNTRFLLDGAWIHVKQQFNTIPYSNVPVQIGEKPYDVVGVYSGGESKISEQLNSTLRMITHVPKLSLLFTTTVQMLWFQKYRYPYLESIPNYIYNIKGEILPFTKAMQADPVYKNYVLTKSDVYFNAENMPPLLLLNFKLSKDIGKRMQISFYSNNVLNQRPVYVYNRGGSAVRRNQSIYFGANIHLKF